jgi:hypothetical protein
MGMRLLIRVAACLATAAALAACGAQRWVHADRDAGASKAALADCLAREARHTTHVIVPVFTRTRDGRMETMFVPDRFVALGHDRASCMRSQGFVRVLDAAADASNR